MRKRLAFVIAALLTACAQLPPVPPPCAVVQQCCVCRYRRDFSCLEVRPSATTPRAEFAGCTRYFCSGGCRRDFVADPTRYVKPAE